MRVTRGIVRADPREGGPQGASTDPGQRRVIADRVFQSVNSTDTGGTRRLPDSVGSSLARVTVSAQDIARDRRLAFLKDRVKPPEPAGPQPANERPVRLLTAAQVAEIKPALVVRSIADYRWSFAIAVAVFFLGFWLMHFFAVVRGRKTDALLLPIVQTLCAIGFMAMVSLRDPLRDTMLFTRFAQGVALLFNTFGDMAAKYAGLQFGRTHIYGRTLEGSLAYFMAAAAVARGDMAIGVPAAGTFQRLDERFFRLRLRNFVEARDGHPARARGSWF